MDFNNLKPIAMDIKVLGTGCSRCKSLEAVTRQAVEELNLEAVIGKVEDIQKIMEYGVLRTPGLVINGKVVLTGQVPNVTELKKILTQNHS
jgi:small redox-active disulfide protein 2